MALADRKIEAADIVGHRIVDRPDTASNQAETVKGWFDDLNVNYIIPAINDVIDDLGATDDGASGLSLIGMTPIIGMSATNPQGAIAELMPCGCRYSNTSAQAIANGGGTVDFATEDETPYGIDPPTRTAAREYTINRDGKYLIEACVQFALNSTGIRGLTILKNTTTGLSQFFVPATGATAGSSISICTRAELADGDVISISAYQNSGGSLNTGTSTVQHISISKIG